MANQNTNICIVSGFSVSSFVVKNDKIRITLEASKDDIKAGIDNLGKILGCLECHCTCGEEAPVELTLMRPTDE